MSSMDLVEFLTARLGEDERIALAAKGQWVDAESTQAGLTHLQRHGPARVLADVAAKRRMVQQFAEDAARCPEDDWPEEGDMSAAPVADHARWALRCLALPYADHPDYREEWGP